MVWAFFEANLGFPSSHLAPPQVDSREPINRLVAIFENSVFLLFYRYDSIREGMESDCKIEAFVLSLFCGQSEMIA